MAEREVTIGPINHRDFGSRARFVPLPEKSRQEDVGSRSIFRGSLLLPNGHEIPNMTIAQLNLHQAFMTVPLGTWISAKQLKGILSDGLSEREITSNVQERKIKRYDTYVRRHGYKVVFSTVSHSREKRYCIQESDETEGVENLEDRIVGSRIAVLVLSSLREGASTQERLVKVEQEREDDGERDITELVDEIENSQVRNFVRQLLCEENVLEPFAGGPVRASTFYQSIHSLSDIHDSDIVLLARSRSLITSMIPGHAAVGVLYGSSDTNEERKYGKEDYLAFLVYWCCYWHERLDPTHANARLGIHKRARDLALDVLGKEHLFSQLIMGIDHRLPSPEEQRKALSGFDRQKVSDLLRDLTIALKGVDFLDNTMNLSRWQLRGISLSPVICHTVSEIGRKIEESRAIASPTNQERNHWLGLTKDRESITYRDFFRYLAYCRYYLDSTSYQGKQSVPQNLHELDILIDKYYQHIKFGPDREFQGDEEDDSTGGSRRHKKALTLSK